MYCERALRAFVERAGRGTLLSTEKPECFQLMRLVASLALMSSTFQEELDDYPTEILRHPVEVTERYMHEPAVLIEASFQHDGVPVWIPLEKFAASLMGQNHPRFDWPIGRLGIEVLNGDKNESADFREQAAVVPKVWAQNTRNRPNELPVG